MKNLIALENDMVLFLNSRRKVRYNDVPLAEDIELDVPVH
jgi:hypothetical protein